LLVAVFSKIGRWLSNNNNIEKNKMETLSSSFLLWVVEEEERARAKRKDLSKKRALFSRKDLKPAHDSKKLGSKK